MLKSGDAVVYKCRGVYKVADIGTLNFSFADRKKRYYTLQSIENSRDKAYIPTDDERNIRKPVSREEALELIGKLDDIETLGIKDEKLREQEYKNCISGYQPENWVRVLKTLYKRTKSRGSITSMDKKYQVLLEHALYSEFAFSLGIPKNEIPEFIRGQRKEK
ncbi:CarD family transcriptional regulator [Mediterraneibacter sp. NSJ-55]|uniref:CarD family transcriptional regulator n=1 Tax=Mediterraneibacter hominis TaxID=2763054 RepID=A0A923LKT2_9FIRM|nr:CarD family transcriptional regulator [Mediterraneibacter hominis]MBC5690110.1 CarD family transcriptional regulator [Mediterraneibacter hominis]